jgi:hypothetical protein
MITGRGSGSGKYSFNSRTYGDKTVYVSYMPEDTHKIRIVFQKYGNTEIPIIQLDNRDAEALWAALNAMAKDLEWKDLE